VSQRAQLDLPAALQELSDAAGNLDTPGGKFRDLFLRMGNALQAGELERALGYADAAAELAKTQALWHLAVPVQVAVATTLLARGRGAEGLERYTRAEEAAEAGTAQADPVLAALCKKLYLQSRLAHGAGLAGMKEWRNAASLFELTVPLAAAENDANAVLDCHRLASFCHEQSGDAERAWQAALSGLAHARQLEPSAREHSTLPSLGEALQRMAAKRPPAATKPVLEQLVQLLETQEPRADRVLASPHA
jgi:tetratricopeptide (TPR) repeat protein